jgi:2-methylisocitrate lyase-like PEP mutase family enzyme
VSMTAAQRMRRYRARLALIRAVKKARKQGVDLIATLRVTGISVTREYDPAIQRLPDRVTGDR